MDILMVLPLGGLTLLGRHRGNRAALTLLLLLSTGACRARDCSLARASIRSHGARLEVMRERTPRSEPLYERWLFIGLEDSGDVAMQLAPDGPHALPINVYKTAPGSFLLVDATGAYRANVATWELARHDQRPLPAPRAFFGCFDTIDGVWRFVPAAERPERLDVLPREAVRQEHGSDAGDPGGPARAGDGTLDGGRD